MNNDNRNNKWAVDEKTAKHLSIVSETSRNHTFYASCKPLFFLLLKNEINALKKRFPGVDFYPEARLKSFKSSLNKKIKRSDEGKSTDIYDFFGVRYVITSVNGSKDPVLLSSLCYEFMDFIMNSIPYCEELTERRKDYIDSPKPNGYQSLHATRRHSFSDEFFSEIQVRTDGMVSETAKHSIYKPVTISRLVDDIPDIFEFEFDDSGLCTDIHSLSLDKAFEKYFGRPFDISQDIASDIVKK